MGTSVKSDQVRSVRLELTEDSAEAADTNAARKQATFMVCVCVCVVLVRERSGSDLKDGKLQYNAN